MIPLNRTMTCTYDQVLGTVAGDGSADLADRTALPARRDENVCTLYAYGLAGRTVIVTDTPSAGSGQGVGRMTRTFYDARNRSVGSDPSLSSVA
jgi:hypothetical protein